MAENTKNYVIDASAVLATILPDEQNTELIKIFGDNNNTYYSTYLLTFEVVNTIKSCLNRKRLTPNGSSIILKNYLELPITTINIDPHKTLQLAIKHNLSFYDASYIYLSQYLSCPLLTLDSQLKKITTT